MDIDAMLRDVTKLKQRVAEADQKHAEQSHHLDELLQFKARAEPMLEQAAELIKSHSDGGEHATRLGTIEDAYSQLEARVTAAESARGNAPRGDGRSR